MKSDSVCRVFIRRCVQALLCLDVLCLAGVWVLWALNANSEGPVRLLDAGSFNAPGGNCIVCVREGVMEWSSAVLIDAPPRAGPLLSTAGRITSWHADGKVIEWSWFGFELTAGPYTDGFSVWRVVAVAIPCWFAVVVLAAWPGHCLILMTRERWRKRSGLCAGCGYDLRASKERCPECGTPFQ
jgi:hypothetical protein